MRKQLVFNVSPAEVETLHDAVDEYVALVSEYHPVVDLVTVRAETTAFVKWLDKQSPATPADDVRLRPRRDPLGT